MINTIDISTQENTTDYLEVRGRANITSLRAIIAHYNKNHLKAVISWYTYDNENNILGHTNPAIFADGSIPGSEILILFAHDRFATNWQDAENNSVFPSKKDA